MTPVWQADIKRVMRGVLFNTPAAVVQQVSGKFTSENSNKWCDQANRFGASISYGQDKSVELTYGTK